MAKGRCGVSYQKRVEEVNRIYDFHVRRGLPNREIWKRYIYPVYAISERTFYNLLKAPAEPAKKIADDTRQLLLFPELYKDENDYVKIDKPTDRNPEHPEGHPC